MILFRMEMPTCCARCPINKCCGHDTKSTERRSSLCPCIAEFPDEYGRIIDQDRLESRLLYYGQHDRKFRLGDIIKYSLAEFFDIMAKLSEPIIDGRKNNE